MYELVPEFESEQREAQANLTEATEDPNQVRKSPRLTLLSKASPGACPTYSKFMQLFIFLFICAFKLQELFETLVQ